MNSLKNISLNSMRRIAYVDRRACCRESRKNMCVNDCLGYKWNHLLSGMSFLALMYARSFIPAAFCSTRIILYFLFSLSLFLPPSLSLSLSLSLSVRYLTWLRSVEKFSAESNFREM